jgi:hypothetical protein
MAVIREITIQTNITVTINIIMEAWEAVSMEAVLVEEGGEKCNETMIF